MHIPKVRGINIRSILVIAEWFSSIVKAVKNCSCFFFIRFYSTYGHVAKLAEEIKKGAASVEGVEVKIWQVSANIHIVLYGSWQHCNNLWCQCLPGARANVFLVVILSYCSAIVNSASDEPCKTHADRFPRLCPRRCSARWARPRRRTRRSSLRRSSRRPTGSSSGSPRASA